MLLTIGNSHESATNIQLMFSMCTRFRSRLARYITKGAHTRMHVHHVAIILLHIEARFMSGIIECSWVTRMCHNRISSWSIPAVPSIERNLDLICLNDSTGRSSSYPTSPVSGIHYNVLGNLPSLRIFVFIQGSFSSLLKTIFCYWRGSGANYLEKTLENERRKCTI